MKDLSDLPMYVKREGPQDQPDGIYIVPHPNTRQYRYNVVAIAGEGWEHVSVSLVEIKTQASKRVLKSVQRCPTWAEMCFIKDLFWYANECVVQYHPPMSEYINNHPFVLHLWKPIGIEMPVPDSVLVGLKAEDLEEMLQFVQKEYPGQSMGAYYTMIYYSDVRAFKADPEAWKEQIVKSMETL